VSPGLAEEEPMSGMVGKLRTAARVYRDQGLTGLWTTLRSRRPLLPRKHLVGGVWPNGWQERLKGALVELRGNGVVIEGSRFSFDSPVIPRYLKGYIASDRYEQPERKALRHFLDPGLPVVELGGCIGVVACLTNKRLRLPEKHVVVEANPDLIPLLERNREQNGCRFTILHRAVAYGADRVTFYRSIIFLASNVDRMYGESPADATTVQTTTFGDLLAHFGFDRCTLVCDIEGAECSLVEHEPHVLRARVATLLLEVHREALPDATSRMLQTLQRLGFQERFCESGTYVFENRTLAGL
jgi:FkbM family methyltransferase